MNGLIEQWGLHHQSTNVKFNILFNITMTNYSAYVQILSLGTSEGWSYPVYLRNIEPTYISVDGKSSLANSDFLWQVKGY